MPGPAADEISQFLSSYTGPWKEEDLAVIRQGTNNSEFSLVVTDPATEQKVDFQACTYYLYDGLDKKIFNAALDPLALPAYVTKLEKGVYSFKFDAVTNMQPEYIAFFDLRIPANVDPLMTKYKLIRVIPLAYYRIMPFLRNQIDKSFKSVSDMLNYGYKDFHLVAYLDLGITMINAIPPYTSFTVGTFPFGIYGKMLIDAATITALESQGLFSIDTDFDYSLGGNALVIDHYSRISGFLSELITRFNTSLKSFKQQFRSKGSTMAQMPFQYGWGRFMSVVPSGFWNRFFGGIGPASTM